MQLIQYLAIILLIYLDFLRIAVKRILFGYIKFLKDS